jgi:uncharacterized protein YjbJ (UPF0337 family)
MTDKNVDEAKGRVKEAAGSITGDDDLKNEGKLDQASSSVKDAADNIADKASGAVDKAREALKDD